MQQCPACHYELTMAEQTSSGGKCPACDVYFAKYQAKQRMERGLDSGKKPTEPTFRLAADPVKVATRGLIGVQPVVVVDVHMRFWSMVVFMVKAALAAIPAMIILFMLGAFLFGMLFSGFASAQSECVNFSSSDIRTLQIKKLIKPGMTSSQVKRIWGDPTKIRSAYPGGDEWEYWNPAGDQVVTFGPQGCVTGWYTHRD